MQIVRKFPLNFVAGQQTIALPNVNRILYVGVENDALSVWVQIYEEHDYDGSATIHMCKDEQHVPENATYLNSVGSVRTSRGMWHAYLELGTG